MGFCSVTSILIISSLLSPSGVDLQDEGLHDRERAARRLTRNYAPGLVVPDGRFRLSAGGTNRRNVEPMSVYCWSVACDAGPAFNQHCFNVSCSLGTLRV